jgi:hypothetical protein
VLPAGHCLHAAKPRLSANFPSLHGCGGAVTVVLLPPAHAKPRGQNWHAASSRLTKRPGLHGPTALAAQSSHWSGTQVMPQPNLARMQRLAVPMQGRRSLPFAQGASRGRQAALQPPQYLRRLQQQQRCAVPVDGKLVVKGRIRCLACVV